jgi:hypothetical protein
MNKRQRKKLRKKQQISNYYSCWDHIAGRSYSFKYSFKDIQLLDFSQLLYGKFDLELIQSPSITFKKHEPTKIECVT